jgi:NAD(P)-dependent dehydrogenase (short-subunit alcohol dehydrogenase family)
MNQGGYVGDLAGKVWFVTGASVGFGRALCEQVIQRGGRLVATARNPGSLAELINRASDSSAVATLDVSNPEQIAAAVAVAKARFGRVDVLANCAGYGLLGALEETGEEEIRAQFEVNFFGLVNVTRAVLPSMRAQRSGTIVNFSSIAGACGYPGSGVYCASKWAVEGLSESLAAELQPFGISVLIVEPGPFRTDFAGRSIAVPARPISEYGAAAAVRDWSASMDGIQPGDPARGAKAIIDTVLQESPPMRLILGASALEVARKASRARMDDVERSCDVAGAADFPA